jgi:hypothetical protein
MAKRVLATSPRARRRIHERRSQVRAPVDFPVRVGLERGALPGTAADLGLGGMFILASDPLMFSTKVTIEFESPITGRTVRLPAVVRWLSTVGFGVQFGALGILDTIEIILIVERAPRAAIE